MMTRVHALGVELALCMPSAGQALICKCPTASRAEVIAATPMVFEGEIIRIGRGGGKFSQTATLLVVEPIKGAVKGHTVRVRTRTKTTFCDGWNFRHGAQTLTVGAFPNPRIDGFDVQRCTMHNLNQR